MKERVPLRDVERCIAAERARVRAEAEQAALASLTERRRVLLGELGKADRRSGQHRAAALSELSQVDRRLRALSGLDPRRKLEGEGAEGGEEARRGHDEPVPHELPERDPHVLP